jgi:hypothetical protein
VVSFTPRPLYSQGKSPWYSSYRRLGGPQSRYGHSGEVKNSQPLPGLKPPVIQPVAQGYTTELSRLLSRNIEIKIYGTIILLVALCRCETLLLTLKEERRLKMEVVVF